MTSFQTALSHCGLWAGPAGWAVRVASVLINAARLWGAGCAVVLHFVYSETIALFCGATRWSETASVASVGCWWIHVAASTWRLVWKGGCTHLLRAPGPLRRAISMS